MKSKIILAVSAGLIGLIANANAAFVDAYATWSGASFGNTASASATFKLDTDYLASVGVTNLQGGYQWITDIELTVTGAADGNGQFTSTNFVDAYFTAFGPVDFSQDLVGQSNFFDFNLFSNFTQPAAPNGYEVNVLEIITSGGGFGERIQLTSLITTAAPVPEPSGLALLALGSVSVLARRRRSTSAA